MARARNIKPGLFKNEILGVADPLYTLLFEGLWVLADREGRMEDRPLRIKAEIFPYRDGINMDDMLSWLASNGFIRRYVVANKPYIAVCEFVKHQNPHKNESASEIPAPDNVQSISEKIGNISDLICGTRADSLYSDSLIPDSPSTDNATYVAGADSAKPAKAGYSPEFEEAWRAYPARPGSSKADAYKAWNARIKEGVSVHALIDGAKRYADYCRACRTEPGFIKQPATFFGPGHHYDSDWTPTGPLHGHKPILNKQEALEARNRSVGEQWEAEMQAKLQGGIS